MFNLKCQNSGILLSLVNISLIITVQSQFPISFKNLLRTRNLAIVRAKKH